MIAGAARDMANAEVVQELGDIAFERGDTDIATKHWAQAARLSDQARQKELTAIAVASREHEARAASAQQWTPHLPPPHPVVEAREPDPALVAKARQLGVIR